MPSSETKEMHGKHREPEKEGIFHRVAYFLLRMSELICAVIVLAILARFTYLVGIGRVSVDGKIVYALVIASIATAFSILFCVPVNVLSMSFPADFILFVCWLVAFGLLAAEDRHCSTGWYNNYWGYYWGRWWRFGPVGRVNVGNTGCGYWRTTLAFSFMASMAHLLSLILVCWESNASGETNFDGRASTSSASTSESRILSLLPRSRPASCENLILPPT